ncbi:hypothetical protein ACFL5U_00780 [Candidatus Margulisiibacteriota bacterium]
MLKAARIFQALAAKVSAFITNAGVRNQSFASFENLNEGTERVRVDVILEGSKTIYCSATGEYFFLVDFVTRLDKPLQSDGMYREKLGGAIEEAKEAFVNAIQAEVEEVTDVSNSFEATDMPEGSGRRFPMEGPLGDLAVKKTHLVLVIKSPTSGRQLN